MSRDEYLKMIDQFSMIIGLLEHKWQRPHSDLETVVMQTLLQMRETIRKAYVAQESEVAG